jgi:hypothetical protein
MFAGSHVKKGERIFCRDRALRVASNPNASRRLMTVTGAPTRRRTQTDKWRGAIACGEQGIIGGWWAFSGLWC